MIATIIAVKYSRTMLNATTSRSQYSMQESFRRSKRQSKLSSSGLTRFYDPSHTSAFASKHIYQQILSYPASLNRPSGKSNPKSATDVNSTRAAASRPIAAHTTKNIIRSVGLPTGYSANGGQCAPSEWPERRPGQFTPAISENTSEDPA